MLSMSLAAGTTEDRARLCSLTQSSINPSSVISGSSTGEAMVFVRTQAHRSILATLVMLASWHRNADWSCETHHREKGNYTSNKNKKCVLGSVTWRLYNTKPFSTLSTVKQIWDRETTWLANNLLAHSPQVMQWEALTGLRHKIIMIYLQRHCIAVNVAHDSITAGQQLSTINTSQPSISEKTMSILLQLVISKSFLPTRLTPLP